MFNVRTVASWLVTETDVSVVYYRTVTETYLIDLIGPGALLFALFLALFCSFS